MRQGRPSPMTAVPLAAGARGDCWAWLESLTNLYPGRTGTGFWMDTNRPLGLAVAFTGIWSWSTVVLPTGLAVALTGTWSWMPAFFVLVVMARARSAVGADRDAWFVDV